MQAAFGYFKKHFLMTDVEVAACRRSIVDCAVANDCELNALFIDEIETAPNEFLKMLALIMELDKRTLIVPSLLHFAGSGNPYAFRDSLQQNGIAVLLSDTPKQAGRVC